MSLGQNDNAILKLLADEQLRKENAALAAENSSLESFLKWKGLREEYQQWLDWRAER